MEKLLALSFAALEIFLVVLGVMAIGFVIALLLLPPEERKKMVAESVVEMNLLFIDGLSKLPK
jgi:UPF0716 family protein affecting phage T7 exclusion